MLTRQAICLLNNFPNCHSEVTKFDLSTILWTPNSRSFIQVHKVPITIKELNLGVQGDVSTS